MSNTETTESHTVKLARLRTEMLEKQEMIDDLKWQILSIEQEIATLEDQPHD